MSYLLETLGRGLVHQLLTAFEHHLPLYTQDDVDDLRARRAECPTSADLAIRLGTLNLRRGELAEAEEAFQAALATAETKRLPLIGLACVRDERGLTAEACDLLQEARTIDPQDPGLAYGVAYCHERSNNLEQAVVHYRSAIALCPQLRNAYERLAAIAIRDGDWGEALACYETLHELEPDDLDILLTLGTIQMERESFDDAIDLFQQALLIEPEPSNERRIDEEDQCAIEEAIASMERKPGMLPEVATLQVRLADLHARQGNDERAVEQYEHALVTLPNFLEATVKLGTQHLRCGRYEQAARRFGQALELNDRLVTAFVGLGLAQHEAGQVEEAGATFDLAAGLEPSSTLLFSEAARLHLKSDCTQEAEMIFGDTQTAVATNQELLEETIRRHWVALQNRPNHADLYYRYGMLMRQVGRSEEAVHAFQNAIVISPNYSKALIKLGIALREGGASETAVAHFRRAIAISAAPRVMHYELALLFAKPAEFELQIDDFDPGLSGEEATTFRDNLSLALQHIGMVDRAQALWRAIDETVRSSGDIVETRRALLLSETQEN